MKKVGQALVWPALHSHLFYVKQAKPIRNSSFSKRSVLSQRPENNI